MVQNNHENTDYQWIFFSSNLTITKAFLKKEKKLLVQ